jgi:hypothetical protein
MPPKETDEIEDMDVESSTASEDAVSHEVEETEVAAPAESSTATDETEVDTLSIVRDVVGAEQETAEAASSAEGEEEQVEGEGEGTPKEPSDDYSDVPFNQHPRFKQLINERNAYRGDAAEYRKVTAFMDANALTAEEAANGISIMGLAKLNPVEAFKQIAPWFKQVAIAAGEILPDDLAARVQKNELTKEAAFEISRLQAAQKAGSVRQEFEQKRGQRTQQMESVNAVRGAAERWEADRQLKDPNFAAKLPRIQEKIAFLHATGQRPTTPEGVREQLKLVYAAVNREAGAAAAAVTRQQPKRPAVVPVRGGQVAGTAREVAPSGTRTTLDIIKAGLKRA